MDFLYLELTGCAVMVTGIAFVAVKRFRARSSPAEIERQRRLAVHAAGKLIAGQVVDVDGPMVNYSYVFAGVEYSASQDISGLEAGLPADPMQMLGAVGVKFDPRNPANSIVICEHWTGLGRSRTQGPRVR